MLATQRQFRVCRPRILTLLSMLVGVAIGCGEGKSVEKQYDSNLRMVAVMYSQYLSAHGGEAPRDGGEFKAYVESLGPGVLQRAGLSESDELFVSIRDGKQFAVKYQNGNWPLEGAIAYEQVGANGTRFVATELGGVSEMAEEQFLSRLKQQD